MYINKYNTYRNTHEIDLIRKYIRPQIFPSLFNLYYNYYGSILRFF